MNNDEETIYAEGYHAGVYKIRAKTEKAIDMAFQLGQIYLQQADSDSYKQQDKSKATLEQFLQLKRDLLGGGS